MKIIAPFRFALLLTAVSLFSGCQSLNRAAKPNAVKASPFLTHAKSMRETPERSPFRLNWTNPSPTAAKDAQNLSKLWISPVSLAYLRPISKVASRMESSDLNQRAAAAKLGALMRTEFANAFRRSAKPRYQIVAEPSSDSMQLDLALVELNPNSLSTGALRTAVNVVAVPGVDSLIGRPLKANIAIEGVLRISRSKEPVYEFSDNEESKSAFLLTFRDFTNYGQARQAIREWAQQFEELTRTDANHRVKDSAAFVFLPW